QLFSRDVFSCTWGKPPLESQLTLQVLGWSGGSMATLHVLKGPNAGAKIPLEKSVTIIGREAKDCDLVVPNQAVSRVHAQVIEVNGQYFLEDLKSRNHTFL